MLKQGLAKTCFANAYQRIPWATSKAKERESEWGFLEGLFAQKRLSYLDYRLTCQLLDPYPDASQEVALFLCHLALAAKGGHLCVHATEEGLNPSTAQLWQNEEGDPLPTDEGHALMELILRGAQQVPDGMMTTLEKEADSIPHRPICREGDDFYLQRHWMFETLFLRSLKRHLLSPLKIRLDAKAIECTLRQLCKENILLEEQAQAIQWGCLHPLTLVTGGPGTGKTYTAGHLIKVFWQHLSEEQRKSCHIVLAAPTGKAAAHLQRSLSEVTTTLDPFSPLQAKTLHALLGIRQGAFQRENKRLTADLVVVDESSMIDLRLMASLFESLKPGSQLVLLGDQHQLPSVEAGSVFTDLIQLHKTHSHLKIPCLSLSQCLRAELKSLIHFAQLLNRGLSQEVLDDLNQTHREEIRRVHLPLDKKEAQRQFLAHVLPYFPTLIKHEREFEQRPDFFDSIRLLSPLRKGLFGVEALNRLIWQKLSQHVPTKGWIPIPIIIAMNDYRQELFNGETGVLMRRLPLQSIGIEDYAFFPSRQKKGQVRRFPALLLPKYELAYCLSVHKSQGSEFDRVVLVLPEGAELFGREMFYTAITRARKCIEIYGSDAVILKTVKQQGVRLSGIERRLPIGTSV